MREPVKVVLTDPQGRKIECQSLTQAWFKSGITMPTLRRMLKGKKVPTYSEWKIELVQDDDQ